MGSGQIFKVSSSLRSECVDEFLLSLMGKTDVGDSLKVILKNRLACESFVKFLGNNQDRVFGIAFDPSALRAELTNTTEINSFFSSGPSKLLLAIYDLIPKFLLSDEFKSWRRAEVQEVIHEANALLASFKITLPELTCDQEYNKVSEAPAECFLSVQYCSATMILESCKESLNDSAGMSDVPSLALSIPSCFHHDGIYRNPITDAMSRCDTHGLIELIMTNSWLPVFFAAVELLSIGVVFSEITPTSVGTNTNIITDNFSIIYANTLFEDMSQTTLENINDSLSMFLQSSTTLRLPRQQELIYSLLTTISSNTSNIQVVDIVSSRSTGVMFSNIIGVKSLLNNTPDNSVKYMISIHHELGDTDSTSYWIETIETLLNILPLYI